MKGLVYDLQRFAIHDGPGIRTLVYMKGCPLKCLWCSSPQTQKHSKEILHFESKCQKCGRCVEACPDGVITLVNEESISIDRKNCSLCGLCTETCLNQALTLIGKEMTVDELFQEIKKDSPFYRRSNGGVTVGGGEPTMQHEFVVEFLKKCKEIYIHTAMETCGYVKWEYLENTIKYLDLLYVDMKHMDPIVHKELTGVSNELILENVKKASKIVPIIIRIPLVPSCNDSEENVRNTVNFASKLGDNLQRIELLPYHKFGTQTYSRLGRKYKLIDVEPPSEELLLNLKEIIESRGVKAQIGG